MKRFFRMFIMALVLTSLLVTPAAAATTELYNVIGFGVAGHAPSSLAQARLLRFPPPSPTTPLTPFAT